MSIRYVVGEMHQYPWFPKHLPNLYIQKIDENGTTWSIPEDEGNVDYLEYKKWLEDGNTPEEYVPVEIVEESSNNAVE